MACAGVVAVGVVLVVLSPVSIRCGIVNISRYASRKYVPQGMNQSGWV